MIEIQTFENEMFGAIRTVVMNDGQIGFVGKDVAEALGYKLPRKAILDHVEKDDVLKRNLIDTIDRSQLTTLVFSWLRLHGCLFQHETHPI